MLSKQVVSLKIKELIWTITRVVGLGAFHHPDARRAVYAHFDNAFGVVLRALYWPVYTVVRRRGMRFIEPQSWIIEAIGHLATDLDSYVKDTILAGRESNIVMLCTRYRPANEVLLQHWSKYIRVVRGRFSCVLLRPLLRYPELADDLRVYCSVMQGSSRTYSTQARWGKRPPLLVLSDAEIARGEAVLREMGVPEGAWFACVHSREAGYALPHEWVNSYRNSNIAHYQSAISAVTDRDGWCIRVGDASMMPLPQMERVVDYAVSPFKSEFMDIFLCARCRFFLGNSSGLFNVAGVFGRRSALANVAPLGCAYSFFPGDISIPKRLIAQDGHEMPLSQAFADPASEYRFASDYLDRGLTLQDNSSDEIRDLAVEMMDRVDGSFAPSPRDRSLQTNFHRLLGRHHYASDAASEIGVHFLRAYGSRLMESEQTARSA